MGYKSTIPQAVMKNRISHFRTARPYVIMVTFHLWNERLIFSSEEFTASEELFTLTAELRSVNYILFPLLWNYGIAVTLCRFMYMLTLFHRLFDTVLSLLICFSVIEVKRKEVVIRAKL